MRVDIERRSREQTTDLQCNDGEGIPPNRSSKYTSAAATETTATAIARTAARGGFIRVVISELSLIPVEVRDCR